jgi:hypothetical protein
VKATNNIKNRKDGKEVGKMNRWVVKTIITYPFLLFKSIQDIVSFPARPLFHCETSASKKEGTSDPNIGYGKTIVAQQENSPAGC